MDRNRWPTSVRNARPTSSESAVEAWAEAVKRAGSPAPAAVIKALHKGKFATVLGWVGFDGKGDLEGGDWQWQVWRDNGQYEVVKGALARIK